MAVRMSVEGFIFDVDDTLYLERDYVRSGFDAVGAWAEREGMPNIADTCWLLFRHGSRGRVFDQALAAHTVHPDPAVIDAMVEVYRSHRPVIELLPDARHVLASLDRLGFRLGVVTGGPVRSQEAKVESLGLRAWCEPIVYSGAWGPALDKPHQRSFEAVEHLTGLAASRLCYVADNPAKDFVGPQRRGWAVIRVRRPDGLHAHRHSEVPECPGLEADRLIRMAHRQMT